MFQYNTLFTAHVPNNILPREAMSNLVDKYHDVDRRITRMIGNEMGSWSLSTNPWMSWNAPRYSDGGVSYSGAWTTRAAKKFFNLYGEKIDEKLLSEIGGFLGQYKKEFTAHFKITEIFDWKPGDFAERGGQSCWWEGRNYCRVGLAARPNGKVILFYKDQEQHDAFEGKKGIGRSWMLEYPDKAFIFNAYGVSLSDTAVVLSSQFNLKHKKIRIESDKAYINAGNFNNSEREGGDVGLGYVLSADVSGVTENSLVAVENFATNAAHCHHCKNSHRPVDLRFIEQRILCASCINELYPTCEVCGERVNKVTEVHYERGRIIKMCDGCIKRKGIDQPDHVCSRHGRTYKPTYLAWHTNKRYCNECMGDGLAAHCDGCRKVVNHYVRTMVDGRYLGACLCIPCSKKLIKELKEVRYGEGQR